MTTVRRWHDFYLFHKVSHESLPATIFFPNNKDGLEYPDKKLPHDLRGCHSDIFLYKNSLYWAQVVTELSDFVI